MNRSSLANTLNVNRTPLGYNFESPQVQIFDERANSGCKTKFNKCLIKYDKDKLKSRQKARKGYYNSKEAKTIDDGAENEKRLLSYMDRNKLYINSLREHMMTNRSKMVN